MACMGSAPAGMAPRSFSTPWGISYRARMAEVNSASSAFFGRRPFQRKKTVSSKVLFDARSPMGMPMYSSTPFSPSMKDSFVSAATTPSSPFEYVVIGSAPFAGGDCRPGRHSAAATGTHRSARPGLWFGVAALGDPVRGQL